MRQTQPSAPQRQLVASSRRGGGAKSLCAQFGAASKLGAAANGANELGGRPS